MQVDGLATDQDARQELPVQGERVNPLIPALVGLIALIVVAQALWLLPALDVRVAARIDGRELEPSPLHLVYIGMEIAKLAGLLLVAAIATSPRTARLALRNTMRP